jgi:RES domain-containing protein
MVVYRICSRAFSTDLSGEGARRFGARWNPIDTAMLYASTHISLAALEILVHGAFKQTQIQYDLLTLFVPEDVKPVVYDLEILGDGWLLDTELTQHVGRTFVENDNFLALVPSAVIPEEQNLLINPEHPLAAMVRILAARPFDFEQRLF